MTPEQERKLKKGDKVVMHTCGEAEHHHGVVWTCKTDEFTTGEKLYRQNLVFLEEYSGSFLTKYLQFVSLDREEQLIAENERLKATQVKLWDCPDCGFAFDAIHVDVETNEYSCPVCEVAEQDKEIQRLQELLGGNS